MIKKNSGKEISLKNFLPSKKKTAPDKKIKKPNIWRLKGSIIKIGIRSPTRKMGTPRKSNLISILRRVSRLIQIKKANKKGTNTPCELPSRFMITNKRLARDERYKNIPPNKRTPVKRSIRPRLIELIPLLPFIGLIISVKYFYAVILIILTEQRFMIKG